MQKKSERYLQHITGLRGFAILMVVLFHMYPKYFFNGFLGVDVFLVITGFLLFYGRNKDAPFSCVSFIKKKVFRIYPLLSVLIIISTIIILPFLYDASLARDYGMSSMSSMLGYSNILYIRKYSDYFATDSNLNPLLHTWYLSVTIQIYLLWAVCGVVLQHTTLCFRRIFICCIAFASLLYSVSYFVQQVAIDYGFGGWAQCSPVSYYDTMGRIWQVLAGGLVYILPVARRRIVNLVLFLAGVLTVCVLVFCNQKLPEYMSIFVVAGTILILRYASYTSMRMLLENKLLLFLGKVSFSLYIIHFPILVFYRRWERIEPDIICGIILFVLFLIFAWGLWRWIETRKFSTFGAGLLVAFSLALSLTARGVNRLGLQWDIRIVPYPVYELTEEHTRYPHCVWDGYSEQLLCGDPGTQHLLRPHLVEEPFAIMSFSGMESAPQFVLVGNSVAQQMYAGFHEVCKARNIPGVHLTTIVNPLWNYHVWLDSSYCWTEEKANAFIDWLRHQSDLHTVVVSFLWKSQHINRSRMTEYTTWGGKKKDNTWSAKLDAAREFCIQVRKAGKHVVFLTPTPVFFEFEEASHLGKGEDYVQWCEQRGININKQDESSPFVISRNEYMEFNSEVFSLLYQLEKEGLCKLLHIERGIFKTKGFAGLHNGTLFCRDKTHITPAASIYIMKGVADELELILRQNQSTPVPSVP